MQDFDLKKRQILDRVNVLDVASEQVALKRRGKRWVGLCPFHAEKTPSFTVSPELGLFKCFGCGKGGDVFTFVQLRENVPFADAMRLLADRAGVELAATPSTSAQGPSRNDLARVNTWATQFFRSVLQDESVGRNAREYLQTRHFSDEAIERFGLGLADSAGPSLRESARRAGIDPSLLLAADLVREGEDGRVYDTFRNRLMFPIRDTTNRVIGFGGRTLIDDRAKYLNTKQNALFDKGRNLYGIHLARDAATKVQRIVVVEGYTDCIAAHQAGFPETVATLGTAMTEAQVDLLRRYCDRIILLFDSDDAGEKAADRAIGVALPRCVAVSLARIPEGKDPSDYLNRAGADAFSDVLNRAVDALEFKWRQTLARFEGGASDAGRRDAVLDFMRVVSEAASSRAVDAIQRGLLTNQVAKVLGVSPADVHREMQRSMSRRHGGVPVGSVLQGDGPRAAPPDCEQAAWTHILEVALNEPGLLATVVGELNVASIIDVRDRRIAGVVVGLSNELGEFRLADVLARCHEPGDAERIEELVTRGLARGNYDSTLRLAFERIRLATRSRDVDDAARRLLEQTPGVGTAEERSEERDAVHDGLKERRHFAPRRFVRRRLERGGKDATDTAAQDAALE